jgi:hypothetical protein
VVKFILAISAAALLVRSLVVLSSALLLVRSHRFLNIWVLDFKWEQSLQWLPQCIGTSLG